MNTATIRINDLEFNVSRDGTIHQPMSVSANVIDEVRIQAGERFLGDGKLTKEQREYWRAVSTVTPEGKRGHHGNGKG